jgi:hypothetical protein
MSAHARIAPSPAARRVAGDMRREYVAEVATRAASFAQRAATAARRGDRRATAVRLRQLHICSVETIETFRESLGDAPEESR